MSEEGKITEIALWNPQGPVESITIGGITMDLKNMEDKYVRQGPKGLEFVDRNDFNESRMEIITGIGCDTNGQFHAVIQSPFSGGSATRPISKKEAETISKSINILLGR